MQLLELVVSLAIAAILLAGMSAAVAISKRTLDSVCVQASNSASAHGGVQLLQNDLREARQIDRRTTTSIEMKVPDRNQDGVLESVHYRWSATAGPLETSSDGVSWRALTPPLSNLQLDWRSREPQSIEVVTPLNPSGRISYMGVTSNSRSDWARSLIIAAPPGVVSGDACVAMVAISTNSGGFRANDGWTKISQTSRDNSVCLAIWYSTGVSGNTTFTWNDSAQAVGCIVHLTGNHQTPYVASALWNGYGQLPAPNLGGSHSQEFVIRALAGVGQGVLSDTPSVVDHGSVLLRQADIANSYYKLTLAVACQSLPGSAIDTATFQFSPASLISCTGTVALRP